MSTISGPNRPSPIPFDDFEVPDVTYDLDAAIRSTYGRYATTSSRDPGPEGHRKVTSSASSSVAEQGRSVLEELSDRLHRGRKSRDAVTSRGESDIAKLRVFGADAGRHDNSVSGSANYPLLVVTLRLVLWWLRVRFDGRSTAYQRVIKDTVT